MGEIAHRSALLPARRLRAAVSDLQRRSTPYAAASPTIICVPVVGGRRVGEPGSSADERGRMPERETIKRARKDAREGKSASAQAGEFVREEMHHVRQGEHGARSTKQAIAIGLSKARRAGVRLPAKKGTSERTRTQAKRDLAKGRRPRRKASATRWRAVRGVLKREGRSAAFSHSLASRHIRARVDGPRRSAPPPRERRFARKASPVALPRLAKPLGPALVTSSEQSVGANGTSGGILRAFLDRRRLATHFSFTWLGD